MPPFCARPIRRAVLSAALGAPLLAAQAQVTVQNGNGTTQVSISSYDPRPAAVTQEYAVTCALLASRALPQYLAGALAAGRVLAMKSRTSSVARCRSSARRYIMWPLR